MRTARSRRSGGSSPPRLIAGLARIVRDVGLAEELAQDALVAALEQWPESGVPDNPGAWLMATAKHRAIDRLRREQDARAQARGARSRARDRSRSSAAPDLDAAIDDHVGDDLLRLMFTACHPVLSTEARVALTLRLLGGLTTEEIARAFLVPEPTVAQRIVRAKRTLAEARCRSRCPRRTSSPTACRRCSRSSTWSSTRATRRPPATTGCGRRSARRRCGSAASWPSSLPRSPRSTASSR